MQSNRGLQNAQRKQNNACCPQVPRLSHDSLFTNNGKGEDICKWTLVPSAFNLGPLPPLGEKLLGLYHFSTA